MSGFQDEIHRFKEAGVQVYGISTDTFFANSAFAEHAGLSYPVLSDHPNYSVSISYGVFNPSLKIATRSYFLIGVDGNIKWFAITPEGPLPNDDVLKNIDDALGL